MLGFRLIKHFLSLRAKLIGKDQTLQLILSLYDVQIEIGFSSQWVPGFSGGLFRTIKQSKLLILTLLSTMDFLITSRVIWTKANA